MSKRHLSHDIRNEFDRLDSKIYDNLEHRNLYIIDFDCDRAIDILNEVKRIRDKMHVNLNID